MIVCSYIWLIPAFFVGKKLDESYLEGRLKSNFEIDVQHQKYKHKVLESSVNHLENAAQKSVL